MKKRFKTYLRTLAFVFGFFGIASASIGSSDDETFFDTVVERFWGTSCSTVFTMSTVISGQCVDAR